MTPLAALPGASRRSELRLWRPFLTVPKSRLLATLAAADIPFADDPSNRDPRFARPRLRELMPRLAAEGLTVQRLALLSERMIRAEIALYDALNEALMRFVPGPWPEQGPVTIDVAAFAGLSEEIALRLLGRLIEWTGNEGPVELGKLEALCASLEDPVHDAARAGKAWAISPHPCGRPHHRFGRQTHGRAGSRPAHWRKTGQSRLQGLVHQGASVMTHIRPIPLA